MNTFFGPIRDMAAFEQLNKVLEKKGGQAVSISGCIDTQKVHISSALGSSFKFRLYITGDEAKAHKMQGDAEFFNKNSIYYPAKDAIFYSADVHGNQISGERIRCISRIIEELENSDSQGLTVVTTIDGVSDMLIPLSRYRESIINIKVNGEIDTEEFCKNLVRMGFERVPMVENKGQFAVRGGIIDIYSYTDEAPVRIELWDTEVDSIRMFDVESQRSIEKLKEYRIFPATEYLFTEEEIENGIEKIRHEVEEQLEKFDYGKRKRSPEQIEAGNRLNRILSDAERTGNYEKFLGAIIDNTESFLEYFPLEDTLVVVDEPNRLRECSELSVYEYRESMKNRLAAGYVVPCETNMIKDFSGVVSGMKNYKKLILTTLDYKPEGFDIDYSLGLEARSISSYNNSFEYLAEDLNRYKKKGYTVILVCSSRTRAKRIVDDLGNLGIESFYTEDFTKEYGKGVIMVTYGSLHNGFEYPVLSFVVIAENDIFTGKKLKKIKKKKHDGRNISGFNELNVGDYVIHENHGLGVYKGIEKIKVEGVEKDYIKISYADNGNLYVLATQLDRLQKYAAQDTEKKPKLNNLGGTEWAKTKSRVNRAVEEVAKDLVELYAQRQQSKGYKYAPDTVWQKEFEEMFPYEETQDQLAAIEDTKADMESDRIMDRLICGDVGYGKTEIAIRAAFKAIQEGKQVAYLVPTTVLASQHYATFTERMKGFPVTVSLLSSFRTSAQNKETISELKKGFVDVVIGTHRLLSKDVSYKDLGLLIIDEEQRFGVTHKEKIKQLKKDIDVLTLSATPIPRTLHMSLVGIRDMSVLTEPPVDRIPIQTFVTEHNDEMIREAINRELARNGQVYYVYNKVKSIDEMTSHIQELVPDANVAYAHGQMDKRALERIMYEFVNGEIDVLVSTTIIETGMDIPNCNTMIIEDADKFGLSQLYQLRGRVGRSNRTAYAFLLYRRDKLISEVAEKRLSAIREFSDLGSGFKIAMKDLEIRGAGNVLGRTQHGHMAAVGYDLYCKMLNEAVNNLKGIQNEYSFETTVDLDVDAFIPATYIKSEFQKLDIYKRIASIETREELSDMKDELSDRYGSVPGSANNLLKIALIKCKAHKIGIMEIKGGIAASSQGPSIWKTTMTVYTKANINADNIDGLIQSYGGALTFSTKGSPSFVWCVTKKKFTNDREYLDGLLDVMDVMENSLITE
ncbi:MAG: transcription-repair coupling factor [Eubacteriales bacterium]|nr:transcription-repair coupling factor [Eubacteriales bacterium]